jgi:hypothetical protein
MHLWTPGDEIAHAEIGEEYLLRRLLVLAVDSISASMSPGGGGT